MKYRTRLLDALRLHFDEHIPKLDVGRRLGIPKSTICDLFVRFKKQGISWPLPDSMTSDKLESLLYPARITANITERRDIPGSSATWVEIFMPEDSSPVVSVARTRPGHTFAVSASSDDLHGPRQHHYSSYW